MEAETRKRAAGAGRRAGKPGRRSHGISVLENIDAITARSEDLQETLQRIVEVVAERASTDVCSLYILDPRAQRLTLWATTGLERSAVGKVTMSVEEGLTGMAIEKLEPVMAVDAPDPSALQVLPGDGRGALPLLPRRPDPRARHADRRARRADAPAPALLARRDRGSCARSRSRWAASSSRRA